MRQDVDVNEKKVHLGADIAVISKGSAWRLGASCSALPRQLRPSEALARAIQSTDLAAEAVALVSHRSCAGELFSADEIGAATSAIVKKSKIFPWLTDPRLAVFQSEGFSNSSCGYAAFTQDTKKSEQRCCAAA